MAAKTIFNPQPYLHIDMLATQLKISKLLIIRATKTDDKQKQSELFEEYLAIIKVIQKNK